MRSIWIRSALNQRQAGLWVGAFMLAEGFGSAPLLAQTAVTPPADELVTLHVDSVTGNMYFTGISGSNMSYYDIVSASSSLNVANWDDWDSQQTPPLSIPNPDNTITSAEPGQIVDWMSMGGGDSEMQSMACANMMPNMNGLPITFDAATNSAGTYSIGDTFPLNGKHDIQFIYNTDLNYNPNYTGTVVYDAVTASANLAWVNTVTSSGDGKTWDLGNNTNWNSGSGIVTYTDGSNVTFDDSTANTRSVTLNVTVSPASVTVNATRNNYTITGTGSIAGSGSLTLASTNASIFTLDVLSTYTGGTFVDGGTLVSGAAGALPSGHSVTVGPNAILVAYSQSTVSNLSWLNLNGSMIVHGGNLVTLTAEINEGYNSGGWNGTSNSSGAAIASSAAATASTHLYALGVIQNDNGSGTPLYTTFAGQSVSDSDVLVKYTYYGDATLDGKVDGSDYSRIDNGYLSHLSGWHNGDFNYDGVVNGSDYTLIDNAFNTQGAVLSASVSDAIATAQIAGASSSVPEPAEFGLAGVCAACLLLRRRRFLGTPILIPTHTTFLEGQAAWPVTTI